MRLVSGMTAAKTRKGEGPAYATPAARRWSACDPAAATRLGPRAASPTITRIVLVLPGAARAATTMSPIPMSVPIQPTRNRPGAARPSIVKVRAPGLLGGVPTGLGMRSVAGSRVPDVPSSGDGPGVAG